MNTLLLSHSARQFFDQCHRKYYWSNVLNLEPKMTPKAFVRGKLGHVATDLVAKKEQTLEETLGQVQMQDPELAKAMNYYFDVEKQGDPKRMAPLVYVKHATSFHFNLIHTINIEGVLWQVDYVGELDGIVEWQDQLWVLERKFTSQIPSDIVARFSLDDQGRGYVWGAQKLGFPVVGVIPDIIRCTKYPETVREPITVPPEAVDEFLVDVRQKAEEILEAIVKKRFPMSPHSCNLMGTCPFKTLCDNPDRAPFALSMGYTKRDVSHEEEVSGRANNR